LLGVKEVAVGNVLTVKTAEYNEFVVVGVLSVTVTFAKNVPVMAELYTKLFDDWGPLEEIIALVIEFDIMKL
jgi:hypothetical protein